MATPRTRPWPPPSAYAARRAPPTVSAAVPCGGFTRRDSRASAVRDPGAGSLPVACNSAPSGAYSTARPPSRTASWRSTAGTGSGRAAAAARPCWASVTRRNSRWRASAISRHTPRATVVNGVRGGISSSGSPWRSHASTRPAGTVSYTGATPKPSAVAPASTTLLT